MVVVGLILGSGDEVNHSLIAFYYQQSRKLSQTTRIQTITYPVRSF